MFGEATNVVTETSRQKMEEIRLRTAWEESVETLQREGEWFSAVRSGTQKDILTMRQLLSEDPNSFYAPEDPRKLINAGERGYERKWTRRIARRYISPVWSVTWRWFSSCWSAVRMRRSRDEWTVDMRRRRWGVRCGGDTRD